MNTLSILVATKDRPTDLQECLRSILAQTARPHEVVIVDQSREAGRARIAELLEGSGVALRYVYEPTLSGLTQARNLAATLATGSILLFLDDDVELAPDYLGEMLAIFDEDHEGRIGGASGFITNLSAHLSKAQRVRSWLFYRGPFRVERDAVEFHLRPGRIPRPAMRLYGCNMAFRRAVMDEHRFDENYSGYGFGEDRDFSVMVSRRFLLRWAPRARLVHKQVAESRLARERVCELRVLSWARFYERCVPKTFATSVAFVWLNIGLLTLMLAFWDPALVRGTSSAFRRLLAIALRQATLNEALQAGWRPGPT